jgi:hypothetical protein
VRLLEMDAAKTTFADDTFDIVYAPYLISVVPDPVMVAREMRRVCKPGGKIVILNHFRSANAVLSRVERSISPLTVHIGFKSDLDLPAFLAKRTEARSSYFGRVLGDPEARAYPGFAPRRLELENTGTLRALDAAALQAIVDKALPNVSAAVAALQERKKDVFAPDAVPIAVCVDRLYAGAGRTQLVDANGAALFLPDDADLEEAIVVALRSYGSDAMMVNRGPQLVQLTNG